MLLDATALGDSDAVWGPLVGGDTTRKGPLKLKDWETEDKGLSTTGHKVFVWGLSVGSSGFTISIVAKNEGVE